MVTADGTVIVPEQSSTKPPVCLGHVDGLLQVVVGVQALHEDLAVGLHRTVAVVVDAVAALDRAGEHGGVEIVAVLGGREPVAVDVVGHHGRGDRGRLDRRRTTQAPHGHRLEDDAGSDGYRRGHVEGVGGNAVRVCVDGPEVRHAVAKVEAQPASGGDAVAGALVEAPDDVGLLVGPEPADRDGGGESRHHRGQLEVDRGRRGQHRSLGDRTGRQRQQGQASQHRNAPA
jgi:hypothetical protein